EEKQSRVARTTPPCAPPGCCAEGAAEPPLDEPPPAGQFGGFGIASYRSANPTSSPVAFLPSLSSERCWSMASVTGASSALGQNSGEATRKRVPAITPTSPAPEISGPILAARAAAPPPGNTA